MVNLDDNHVDITVQIDNLPSKLVLVSLNPKQNSEIRMNDTLSFAINHNNSASKSLLVNIAREDEEKIILEKIVEKTNKTLYLKTESGPNWKFLKDKLKLEYGCTVTLENANKRAFTIVDFCTISKYNKVSLKFKLEPTMEFIEAVNDIIKSKDPRKFKEITIKFGQFISKEVILGGRAYFIARDSSKENASEDVNISG
ncbi:hypothetical protein C1645_828626 [Glomus cerebriforme]|uniref:Uncharacterized protein n=1 Tax=Glomus cerebriforme TaxID=658196 RepID=A0A397SLD9_9GLOM|nr:hypothetical protein C1645_828626 [Glomus cerebriforme]